jgi:hypothetical protein
MEILLVRCLWPGCEHVESDSSLEAAKRRLLNHIREAHHAGLVVVGDAGDIVLPHDLGAGDVEGVPA